MDIEPIARSAAQASADELLAQMCSEIEAEVLGRGSWAQLNDLNEEGRYQCQ